MLKVPGAIDFDFFLTENVAKKFNFKETTLIFYDFYLQLGKMSQILKQCWKVVSIRTFVLNIVDAVHFNIFCFGDLF